MLVWPSSDMRRLRQNNAKRKGVRLSRGYPSERCVRISNIPHVEVTAKVSLHGIMIEKGVREEGPPPGGVCGSTWADSMEGKAGPEHLNVHIIHRRLIRCRPYLAILLILFRHFLQMLGCRRQKGTYFILEERKADRTGQESTKEATEYVNVVKHHWGSLVPLSPDEGDWNFYLDLFPGLINGEEYDLQQDWIHQYDSRVPVRLRSMSSSEPPALSSLEMLLSVIPKDVIEKYRDMLVPLSPDEGDWNFYLDLFPGLINGEEYDLQQDWIHQYDSRVPVRLRSMSSSEPPALSSLEMLLSVIPKDVIEKYRDMTSNHSMDVKVELSDTEDDVLVSDITLARISASSRKRKRKSGYTRLYMDHETRSAFRLVWRLLWDTVKRITHREVRFKALHGDGIATILVDGSHPQIMGCGDDLVQRNLEIHESHRLFSDEDPASIVTRIMRICLVHLDRNFDKLAHHLTREETEMVCSIRHLEDPNKVLEYWDWCESNVNPHIRDWSANKRGQPYFVALINEHHTKIPEEDWYLSPSDTDMNESAHPYTNLRTGSHLTLADGIELARIVDAGSINDMKQCEREHDLSKQNKNTVIQRHNENLRRRFNAGRWTQEINQDITTLSQADEAVASATSDHKAAIAELSRLKDLKKQLHLPRGTQTEYDTAIKEADICRAEAYRALQKAQDHNRTLRSSVSVPCGLRTKLSSGQALPGKSALADTAYDTILDDSMGFNIPCNDIDTTPDNNDFQPFTDVTNVNKRDQQSVNSAAFEPTLDNVNGPDGIRPAISCSDGYECSGEIPDATEILCTTSILPWMDPGEHGPLDYLDSWYLRNGGSTIL
ncbi:hypothetical protein ARMGADRAFT_1128235 [Armillaria gallica]|uniref:Uncharacterized protein n=1 Tax=Armillaria gallica TaxID=47427 RepID=A0A2H3CWP5_ARMGA|nr:hypothetical protein ARMGADRAFT_1128235 [Armillaria gallica]